MLPDPIIYLDYNATTPVAPEVVNEMLPVFLSNYGNSSSSDHLMGWKAKELVENARDNLASCLGASGNDLIFTAGATEAINMVLRGLRIGDKNHIITAKTEHSAVLDTCKQLEKEGFEVTYLDVDKNGLINLEELKSAITEWTLLVTIMWVNNETGVIQPVEEIGSICREAGVVFMSDATQAIGKIRIDISKQPIDIILGSAHKIYGPKGVGFLCLNKELQQYLAPVITGGGQEFRKRAGTTNVPSIIGMAKAVDLAYQNFEKDSNHIKSMRDRFEKILQQEWQASVNGSPEYRLYNTSNLCFNDFDSERIMQAIGGKLAASRGSACSTGKIEPSHVLTAMKLSEKEAHSSIRFSFGRYTTGDEIDRAIRIVSEALKSF